MAKKYNKNDTDFSTLQNNQVEKSVNTKRATLFGVSITDNYVNIAIGFVVRFCKFIKNKTAQAGRGRRTEKNVVGEGTIQSQQATADIQRDEFGLPHMQVLSDGSVIDLSAIPPKSRRTIAELEIVLFGKVR